MRRGVSIAMVVFGLITMITGLWKLWPPFNDMFYPAHAVNAFTFAILLLTHIYLNWKQLLQYFKRLGWWWLVIGLGVADIFWVVYVANTRLVPK